MAGAIFLGVMGLWLVAQSMGGRLPARLLSYRSGNLAVIGTSPGESSSSTPTAPSSAPGAMAWPTHGRVSQEFHTGHDGIDIAANCATTVTAPAAGVVTLAGVTDPNGYGNEILIDHGGGIVTLYGHLSAFAVKRGDTVRGGQPIGAVGSTGHSTGCHLHWEVHVNGAPVNPRSYVGGNP